MAGYQIDGGRRLEGTLTLQGAKNSALPILAATILVPGVSVLHHCPVLSDTENALGILSHLGCRVERQADTVVVDASQLTGNEIPAERMAAMRSSILFAGALLNRTGSCRIWNPGGCRIGKRPIDLHLQAFSHLGCQVEEEENGCVSICRNKRQGGVLTFPFSSVGATENSMLAAAGQAEKVMILPAAREPEIADLQGFLRKAGFGVEGAGSSTVILQGGQPAAVEYDIMPDRICGETYLAAVAATGGKLHLKRVRPEHSQPMLALLRRSGCEMTEQADGVILESPSRLAYSGMIRTEPYPGFPTDSGALATAALLRAKGVTVLEETIFENRFRHIEELRRLGADLTVCGKLCRIRGVEALTGAAMTAADLRGGAALVIGALQAQGKSQISGIEYMHRGYENFAACLQQLGAEIRETGVSYGKKEEEHSVGFPERSGAGYGKT